MIYLILYEIITNTNTTQMFEVFGGYLNSTGIFLSAGISLGLMIIEYALYYAFRSAAIYKMAKRQGYDKLWLAFVPCACFYLLGKLQDNSGSGRNTIWGYIAIVSSSIYVVMALLLDILGGIPTFQAILSADPSEAILSTFIATSSLIGAVNLLMSLANIVFAISCVFMYLNVFRAYAPEKAFKYSLISVAVDIFFGTSLLYAILLFKLRNNEKRSYYDYARARSNFYRGGGGYGGRDYYGGNRYGGYNPYGNDRGDNDNGSENRPEEPFSEFSSGNDQNGDNSGEPFGNDGKPYDSESRGKYDDGDDLFS